MEKKNNDVIIILMGIIIVILMVLCILFATDTIKFNYKIKDVSKKNNTEVEKSNDESYNAGDILFSLYNKNNQLYTSWGNYMPKVESNKGDNIYFKKL